MVTRHTSPSWLRLFNVEQIGEDKTHPGDNLALQRLNYKYTMFVFKFEHSKKYKANYDVNSTCQIVEFFLFNFKQ